MGFNYEKHFHGGKEENSTYHTCRLINGACHSVSLPQQSDVGEPKKNKQVLFIM